MSERYPLYPTLPEKGAEEAQALVDQFKVALKTAAEEVLGSLYCDLAIHIESDSWLNFRNSLLAGLCNYGNRALQAPYDYKQIREAIYKEYRDDIIADLDQDNLARIAELEKLVDYLRKSAVTY